MNPIEAYAETLAPIAAHAVAQGERALLVEAMIDLLLALVPSEDPARGVVETVARGYARQGVHVNSPRWASP